VGRARRCSRRVLAAGLDLCHDLTDEIVLLFLDAGADFEALAKKQSEDGSAERGGDLGSVGRGLFAPSYESAAFALKPGEVSAVVESDFGFHIIQRIE